MSISRTAPARSRPGGSSRPAFIAPNVTVVAAGSTGGDTDPSSGSTPLGRSTATTAGPVADSRTGSIARTASRAGDRRPPRAPLLPLPASTRSRLPPRSASSSRTTAASPRAARAMSGTPASRSGCSAARTCAADQPCSRCAGTIRPSCSKAPSGTMSLMRIIVTGGNGKLGRAVVAHLKDSGNDVFVFDRVAAREPGYFPVDLTDYGQVLDAVLGIEEHHHGVDAIVHLAAIPAPGIVPDVATFDNNVPSTYHV